jgi:hypothetical protein
VVFVARETLPRGFPEAVVYEFVVSTVRRVGRVAAFSARQCITRLFLVDTKTHGVRPFSRLRRGHHSDGSIGFCHAGSAR